MSSRRANALIGAAALVALVFMGVAMARFLGGAFESGYEVTARFDRAGQLLRSGSDVKFRGVLVGQVARISTDDSGVADVTMRLFEEHRVPANVMATVRAKTLFGEKLISFSLEGEPSEVPLAPGDVIGLDRTTPPMEVETILEKAVPVLNAIDPAAFGAALQALAEGFVGNEDALRRATLQSETLLTETQRTLPNLERNLVHLRNFASALDRADDDLLAALDGLTAVGEALVAHRTEFGETIDTLLPLSDDLGEILTAREDDLGVLAREGRAVVAAVAERAETLPDTVELLHAFLGVWVANLSEGPNWRILVTEGLAMGTPYPPGEEPAPRQTALRRISGTPEGPLDPLIEILTAGVPTRALEDAASSLELPELPLLEDVG